MHTLAPRCPLPSALQWAKAPCPCPPAAQMTGGLVSHAAPAYLGVQLAHPRHVERPYVHVCTLFYERYTSMRVGALGGTLKCNLAGQAATAEVFPNAAAKAHAWRPCSLQAPMAGRRSAWCGAMQPSIAGSGRPAHHRSAQGRAPERSRAEPAARRFRVRPHPPWALAGRPASARTATGACPAAAGWRAEVAAAEHADTASCPGHHRAQLATTAQAPPGEQR